MRIKTSVMLHILYRYSGLSDCKGVEAKIGSALVGIAPDYLSVDIMVNLTPREVRELREHLVAEQASIFKSRFVALMNEVDDLSGLIKPENIDAASV